MKRDGFSDAALFLSAFAVVFMAAFVIGTAFAGGLTGHSRRLRAGRCCVWK